MNYQMPQYSQWHNLALEYTPPHLGLLYRLIHRTAVNFYYCFTLRLDALKTSGCCFTVIHILDYITSHVTAS